MGGLIHLPQLQIPSQAPDPLGDYQKLASIQALQSQTQQKQAFAPGQLQQQQQELEAGLLANQGEQRKQKQAQALDIAFNSSLTPDPVTGQPKFDSGKVLSQVAASGNGSLVPQLTETFNKIDQEKATLVKTKQDTASAMQDYMGSLGAELKGAGYSPAAAGVVLAHLSEVDPNTAAQLRQQFTQDPSSIQRVADAAIAASPKQQEAIKNAAQGAQADTENQIKQLQLKGMQGGAGGVVPGVPLENQEASAYMATHPGKNLMDFAKAKASLSPMAVVMGNQLGQGGQGSALDQAAERYSTDGSLPAGFSRSPGTTAAIIQRSAQLHPEQNIAANKATFSADSAALKKVQGTFDQVSAFENTAVRNLDLYVQKAEAIPDIGVKFANVPLRMITGGMIGEKNYAAMQAARQTAATEAAKVLSSATGSGVLSDSQKKDAMDVLNGNLPLAATRAVVNTFKQDFANRSAGYQQDIDAIKHRINPQAGAPSTPQASPAKSSDFFSAFGGQARQ
jgi:hypothetical protein